MTIDRDGCGPICLAQVWVDCPYFELCELGEDVCQAVFFRCRRMPDLPHRLKNELPVIRHREIAK